MTDTEMAEAVQLARAFDDAGSNVMKMGHALTIARALLESRRQVEALTKERDEARTVSDAWRDHLDAVSVATARAERAERELAVIKAACPTSTVLTEHCRCGSGAHPRECKRHPFAYETHVASMDAEAREVAVAVTTERARLVEAIAAWHDRQAGYLIATADSHDTDAARAGHTAHYPTTSNLRARAAEHMTSAAHLRSHNWAPPEEDGK